MILKRLTEENKAKVVGYHIFKMGKMILIKFNEFYFHTKLDLEDLEDLEDLGELAEISSDIKIEVEYNLEDIITSLKKYLTNRL